MNEILKVLPFSEGLSQSIVRSMVGRLLSPSVNSSTLFPAPPPFVLFQRLFLQAYPVSSRLQSGDSYLLPFASLFMAQVLEKLSLDEFTIFLINEE